MVQMALLLNVFLKENSDTEDVFCDFDSEPSLFDDYHLSLGI